MTADDAALLQSQRLERAAQRLAELLPAAIRSRDVAQGHPLQALLAVLASGAAELDAALDMIADAAFVETADAAALEDLGRLVGATPLAPTPQGSGHDLRAYVANALRRRAGKGVAQALEALAADVSGFGVTVVEYFQRVSRCEHLLDVRADRPGLADLRAASGSGAFDRLPRLPDFRSIARGRGRAHIPHVGVHVLRPVAAVFPAPSPDVDARPDELLAALAGAPAAAPWAVAPGFFRLAAQPDGVVRLFNPDTRSARPDARVGREALPDRLARLPLHRETQALRRGRALAEESRWFSHDRPFTVFLRRAGGAFERVPPERLRIVNLEAPPLGRPHDAADGRPIDCVIDPVTGRLGFPAPAAGQADVAEARVAYACGVGGAVGAGPQDRNSPALPFDIVDAPGVKHFIRVVDAASPTPPGGTQNANLRIVATLAQAAAELDGADDAVTRALLILNRCDRESGAGVVLPVRPGLEVHVVAAAWRPRQTRAGVADNPDRHGHLVRKERKYTLEAPLTLAPARAPAAGERAGVVVLDGLELAGGLTVAGGAVSGLRVRHCVLRAPGAAAVVVAGPLAAARLAFERSILGRLDAAGADLTGALALSDCIVATDGAAGAALDAPALDGELRNVTVMGATRLKSLAATNALFVEPLDVARTQEGCVRYSYAPPGSRAPRRFQCQPDRARAAARDRKGAPLTPDETAMADLSVRPRFLDAALDEPTLALLHPAASDGLRLGGEGDVEIGAFANVAAGVRMANLRRLFPEFMPFGLDAGVIDDTLSTAAARRRNRP